MPMVRHRSDFIERAAIRRRGRKQGGKQSARRTATDRNRAFQKDSRGAREAADRLRTAKPSAAYAGDRQRRRRCDERLARYADDVVEDLEADARARAGLQGDFLAVSRSDLEPETTDVTIFT